MSYEKLGLTNGTVLTAEHLNHIEDGIANAGGVTDYNDLENKPCGYIFGEEQNLLSPYTVYSPNDSLGVNLQPVLASFAYGHFRDGIKYTVILKGVSYEVTCEGTGQMLSFGNASLMGGEIDTGEPFFIGISFQNFADTFGIECNVLFVSQNNNWLSMSDMNDLKIVGKPVIGDKTLPADLIPRVNAIPLQSDGGHNYTLSVTDDGELVIT